MKIDNKRLLMSSSPYVRSEEDTRSIMMDVVVALVFPLIMAVYFFGWRAATLTLTSVASCIAFEWLYRYIAKKTSTIGDLSAVVTGMLIALCLPVSAPLWMPVVGAFFAIVVVKQLYGGLGKNFLNPALAARAFLFSWPAFASVWIKPNLGSSAISAFGNITHKSLSSDVVAAVTPLMKMKQGVLPSVAMAGGDDVISSLRDVVVGNVAGYMGEVSAVVIVAAAIYLLVRHVITIHIPAAYVGTVAVLTFLFPLGGNAGWQWMLYSVCSGGLLFGAVFMATDYTTSPVTAKGRVVYGIGCGVLTVLIRYYGVHSDGVTYAILIMNCCACFMDRVIRPRRFGVVKAKRKAVGEDEDKPCED